MEQTDRPTSRPPNVLFIMVDSLPRRDHVGAYQALDDGRNLAPWRVHTPALDALARESVLFTHAFPECLPTVPVRRAVHTGHRTWPVRDWVSERGGSAHWYGWQRIPDEQVTLAEFLAHGGYRTGFYSDTYHLFKPTMNFHRGFGQWEWVRGQEADRYRAPSIVPDHQVLAVQPPPVAAPAAPPGAGEPTATTTVMNPVHPMLRQYLANTAARRVEEDYFAPAVFRSATRFLEENAPDRTGEPFFLYVDSFDPHEPWDPPASYTALYDPGYAGRPVITPRYGPSDYLSEAELRHMRALYAGEVTMVDAWIGRLLQRVRDVDAWDNTAIIFVSDHGHQLGEHGLTGKVPAGLFPELTDIPLLIKHPHGTAAGTVVDAFVYCVDVFATVLGFSAMASPTAVSSRNLWGLVAGPDDPAAPSRFDHVVVGCNHEVMVRTDPWGYIAHGDGTAPRLYDLRADPGWRRNLAGDRPQQARALHQLAEHDAGGPLPRYDRVADQRTRPWWQRV